MKYLSLFLLISFSGFSQDYEVFYHRKTKQYGIKHKKSSDISALTDYKSLMAYTPGNNETNYFIAGIKDKEDNTYEYFIVDHIGKRISSFKIPYATSTLAYYNSDNLSFNTFQRSYLIDTNCACIPESYMRCPNSIPLDTTHSNTTLKWIQQLEYLYEFSTLDTTLALLNNMINMAPDEPELYFYKAWLLQYGYEFGQQQIDPYYYRGRNQSNGIKENYWELDSIPAPNWYQKQFNQLPPEDYHPYSDWEEKNEYLKDSFSFPSYYLWELEHEDSGLLNYQKINQYRLKQIIESLDKVIQQEESGHQIIPLVYAWKNNIINQYSLNKKEELKELSVQQIESNISLKSMDIFKSGAIITADFRTGKQQAIGVKLGGGYKELAISSKTSFCMRASYGFYRYFSDQNSTISTYHIAIELSGRGYMESSSNRQNSRIPSIPLRFYSNLYNLELNTKPGGVKAIGYFPEVGTSFWNFDFKYGYNITSKEKFPELKGHYFSIGLHTLIFPKKHYILGYSDQSNFFDF